MTPRGSWSLGYPHVGAAPVCDWNPGTSKNNHHVEMVVSIIGGFQIQRKWLGITKQPFQTGSLGFQVCMMCFKIDLQPQPSHVFFC